MPARRDPRVFAPFPELVEPRWPVGPWRVLDSRETDLPSSGAVSQIERWIAVPLTEGTRPITRHELAHVVWSPQKLPRVRFDVRLLAAIEDARINLGLEHLGVPVVPDERDCAHVRGLLAQDAKRGDVFALLVRSIAAIGTGVEDDLLEDLAGLGRVGRFVAERVAWVRRDLVTARQRGSAVAPFRKAHRLARRLARDLAAHRILGPDGRAQSDAVRVCCVGHGHGDETGAPIGIDGGDGPGVAADVVPGRMHITRPPLTRRLRPGGLPGRGGGPAQEGGQVRYLHRWPLDRAIFRRPRRHVGGGTVLLDASGSMSLSTEDIDRLLLATPAGVRVAVYSGSQCEGELRIVADRGRRADAAHLRPPGRGNVVDVLALAWLARQPGRRIWVSDGAVTGVGDRASAEVRRRAAAVRRRGAIRRVATIDQAVELLAWPRAAGGT